MRITLTGRRLALAAVLVLAGVAAPLAWATVAGKGGSNPSGAAAASPTSLRSASLPSAPIRSAPIRSASLPSAPLPSLSPQAATATGDNPYQHSLILSYTPNQDICPAPGFPAGVNFALTQVSVLAAQGLASVQLVAWVKTGVGSNMPVYFSMPLDSLGRGAVRSFDWVVKPNPFGSAAVGDIYDLYPCVINGSTANTVAFFFTGQKTPAGATAAAVSDFSAIPGKRGTTTLRWMTGSETEILGFNVWRYRGAKGVKVNRTLIRAKRGGEPAGASYRYIDPVRGAKRGLTYRLQLVDLKGKRTWYAAFAIASK